MTKVIKENSSTAYVATNNLGELIFNVSQNDGNKAEIVWETEKIPRVWWTMTKSCIEAAVRRFTCR